MKKTIIMIALILSIMRAGAALEHYTGTAITDSEPIQARNTRGEQIQLYPAKTDGNNTILLEDVKPNTAYVITIDTCGTASREDDLIIRVKEATK